MACMGMIYQFLEDLKTMQVDCRKNWLLTGATIALFLASGNSLWYIGLVVVFVFLRHFLLKIMADGDVEILQWLFPGVFLFGGLFYVFFFVFVLLLAILIWSVFIAKSKGISEKHTQGTVFLTFSLALTVFYRFFYI